MIVAGGAGAVYYWRDIEGLFVRTQVNLEPIAGGALNVLVLGSDSREGLTSKEDVRRFGRVGGRRADTIIIAQVVPSQKRGVLLSFPRDLYVNIPGHGAGKINTAYQFGPQSVIDTVQQLTGIPINHYLEVDLAGFRRMVDAIGGIDVCLEKPLRDTQLKFRLPAGVNHLAGDAALSFVRSRHSESDGDFGRIRRQQQFFRAVARKVGKPSVLGNPFRVNDLARSFASNVTVDQGFNLDDIVRLALQVRRVGPEQIATFTVPGRLGSAGGQSVVKLDVEPARRLFAALRDVADPRDALAPPPVQVAVEDASGLSIAQQVAGELTARGFQVTRTAVAQSVRRGTVVYAPRPSAEDARRLQAVVPGASLTFQGTEIRLVLGSSYRGLATPPPPGRPPAPTGPCAGFPGGG